MINFFEIFVYFVISAITFFALVNIGLYSFLKRVKEAGYKDMSLKTFLMKEFFQDNNNALALYLGSRLLSIGIIISHAMALGVMWILIFGIIGVLTQDLLAKMIGKTFGLDEGFEKYIIEKQNTPVAILYALTLIGSSYVVGSVLL